MEDEGDEGDGEFEDLETGEKFGGEAEAAQPDDQEKAIEAERKRLEAEAREREKLEAAARSAAEADAAEARAELSEWEDDSEWEGFQSGAEDDRPVSKQPGRKTQAQRNRIKRRKEAEQQAKQNQAKEGTGVRIEYFL